MSDLPRVGCRIGRVRLKAGGAAVRLLPSPEPGEMATRLRLFGRAVLTKADREPDAMVLVAWWFEGDGLPAYAVNVTTNSDRAPLPLLPALAAEQVRKHLFSDAIQDDCMRALGYSPDPAS